MFTVTLEQLRTNGACFDGYNKVVRMLQGQEFTEEDEDRESYIRFKHTEQISLADICRNQGVIDALWATRCLDSVHDRDLRLYVVWCVRQFQHLLTDERSIRAIDVAERFANGEATEKELDNVRRDALNSQYDNYTSIAPAAHSAAAASVAHAAYRAAYYAVSDAACYTAYYAADTADYGTERLEQTEMFIKMCEGTAPWQTNN